MAQTPTKYELAIAVKKALGQGCPVGSPTLTKVIEQVD
jgi:hypothetical protein